jgi:Domain of unknown function (DUF397)
MGAALVTCCAGFGLAAESIISHPCKAYEVFVIDSEASNPSVHSASARSYEGGGFCAANVYALTDIRWRKSSWSSYNGNCVEVAELDGLLIGVRDTKDGGSGPVLVFDRAAWRSFLDGLKSG